MSKKIAIIGVNEQQAPLIYKAKEMGLETHSFSWHGGNESGADISDFFYPISAMNKEAILEKCKEIGVSAVVSLGSDIAALSAAYVSDNMSLVGNTYEAVSRAVNKLDTRKILSGYHIPQPKFVEIADQIPFDSLRELRYPLVVKPSDRSGGRGVRIITDEKEFFSAINAARDISFERKAIVEEYVKGQFYSCECFSLGGEHKIIAYTKREIATFDKKPSEYMYTQPANIALSVRKKLESYISKILSAIGLTVGASSVEFIVDENNDVYFIEVSPCACGDYVGTHLIPMAYGVDFLKLILDAATGSPLEICVKETQKIVSAEFYYEGVENISSTEYPFFATRSGHKINIREMPEFGGCPKFKISPRRPYYFENDFTVALNSEYTAFWYALKQINPKYIHLPFYSSATWSRVAEELGIECKYYHIDDSFLPIDISAGDDDAVLLINYYGLCQDYIKSAPYVNKIVDNSMAFYQEPILDDGVYNIYSCRKFFAVPDGAYLISLSLDKSKISLERDVSYKRASALLKSLELGESTAYKEMQTNEQELAKKRLAMSALTEKLLASIDYEQDKSLRKNNFKILNSSLIKYNQLSIEKEDACIGQFYPLLVTADIRNALLDKKIYVPLMWRRTLGEEFEGLSERKFSKNLVSLPISSEYSAEETEYLLEIVVASVT